MSLTTTIATDSAVEPRQASGRPLLSKQARRLVIASCMSAVVHAGLMIALGLLFTEAPAVVVVHTLVASVNEPTLPSVVVEKLNEPLLEKQPNEQHDIALPRVGLTAVAPLVVAAPKPAATRPQRLNAEQVDVDVFAGAPLLAGLEPGKYKAKLGYIRSPGQRLQAVLYRGGSIESERAVAKSLAWIARHQSADGGWNFDHRLSGDCNARCRHAGALANARIAATSMALLPFLAAGETHKQGQYKKQVEAGLKFLVHSMQPGGALTQGGGTMYSQALATIVLCEASAMTRDRDLIAPSRSAMNYIVNAQDQRGGGWRYFPGMPGDTSVTGWQVMALKSADNAYHPVPPISLERVRAFLDFVQQEEGSAYGYTGPEATTTASTPVGLLCRMQLGWKRTEPALIRGVEVMAAKGPLPNNIYYNFYATQVMHHFGGPQWEAWNKKMRDHLVRTQAQEGHEMGSWFFVETEPHDALAAGLGGRLYSTSLAVLTLEVYYRHLPLYGNRIFIEEPPAP